MSEGRVAPVDYRIVSQNGTVRRLRLTISAADRHDGGPSSTVGVVEDVTDEVGADHEIASHIAVSDMLNAWGSLEDGAPRLLGALAGALEFHFGTLWAPAGDVLLARAIWADPAHEAAGFAAATRRLRLPPGVCLPGKVWEVGLPINVVDVQRDALYGRCAAAIGAGLRGAVGIPALSGEEVVAVIELHRRDAGALDERLMRSLAAVGSEVGRFLVHRRGELGSSPLTARQLEIIALAAQGRSGGEIAEQLCISATTVKSHFTGIYARLGVSDRAAAVAEAIRHGLIE